MMRRQRGMALILALLLVALAALLALTAASRSRSVAMDSARDRASADARAAAQGGVERARWALSHDAAYTGETVTIGTSTVTLTVTGTGRSTGRSAGGSAPDGNDTVSVTAIARAPAAPFADSVTSHVVAELRLRDDDLPAIVAWHE